MCDRGIGLDGVEPDRLFEAFYTTKPQGMGMGLAISRSIIEAHGGRLWAESVPGGAPSSPSVCLRRRRLQLRERYGLARAIGASHIPAGKRGPRQAPRKLPKGQVQRAAPKYS